jgi:hypothetical protein
LRKLALPLAVPLLIAAAASTSPNSLSVRRVAMDLAQEVSFTDPAEDDGRIVSCGLSLAEAIRDALLEQVSLEALGCLPPRYWFLRMPQLLRNVVHNTAVYSRKHENPNT